MRILMTSDTIGGVWRFTQELTSGLLSKGCDVALVSLGTIPSFAQSTWAAQMRMLWPHSFSFVATNTPLEWMASNESAYHDAAPFLLQTADEFRADVIHSNQYCFGALGKWLPTVVTAHSDVLSWAAACRPQPLEQSAWLIRYCSLVDKGLAYASAVTAPTQWMLDALSHNFAVPSLQRVIPNGRLIEVALSGMRRLQAVTAGRLWDPAKNLGILRSISSTIPIFAAGNTFCQGEEVPPPQGVHLLGEIPEEDLLSLFSESAIYVCTSRYEPFGLAPLEAALCGCAVLVNNIPSLREVWEDAALYFSDSNSLRALLQELGRSPEYLLERQTASQNHAQTFTRERMTEAYLTIFERAMFETSSKEMVDVA